MKYFFTLFFILFSVHSNATLDSRSWCNGQITHWNLYEVKVTPYHADSELGALEFWMGFNSAGDMLPQLYWSSADFYYDIYNQAILDQESTGLIVYSTTTQTGQQWQKAKGCYFTFTMTGTSYGTEFAVLASATISRDNAGWSASGIRDTSTDADFFADNHAVVTYGGYTFWASVTFTQIR